MRQTVRTLRNQGLFILGVGIGGCVYLATRLWFWLAVIALLLWRMA